MSLQLVHLAPEATFLIIEVPVAVGKENPAIKTLWEHIPAAGKGAARKGRESQHNGLVACGPRLLSLPRFLDSSRL